MLTMLTILRAGLRGLSTSNAYVALSTSLPLSEAETVRCSPQRAGREQKRLF